MASFDQAASACGRHGTGPKVITPKWAMPSGVFGTGVSVFPRIAEAKTSPARCLAGPGDGRRFFENG
jgi:hypothetical protein